jgi:hypothetical protein
LDSLIFTYICNYIYNNELNLIIWKCFNKKVLDERLGPLRKNGLDHLEEIEGYVIRKCQENDIETSYDVMADENAVF